jgi:hypothetical protein
MALFNSLEKLRNDMMELERPSYTASELKKLLRRTGSHAKKLEHDIRKVL